MIFLLRLCVWTALMIGVCSLNLARADQEQMPTRRVFASSDGAVAFAMLPPTFDEKTYKVMREGRGIMYKLESDGRFKELYRTDGWYTYEAYPSSDGRYLVRMGPWNRGQNVSTKDLAVAFYRDGKLLKQYSTAALVKDTQKVRSSVSHYFWRMGEDGEPGDAPRLSDHDRTFTLRTIDSVDYVFDIASGAIKSATGTPLPGAKDSK